MVFAVLLACRSAQEVPPADPIEPAADPAPAIDGGFSDRRWTSAACGERAYPRELTLAAGGTYTGRDLVSPCPEGATCVWSGIIDFAGTWTQAHDLVTLEEASATAGPGTPRPRTVRWESAGSRLLDDLGCAYTAG